MKKLVAALVAACVIVGGVLALSSTAAAARDPRVPWNLAEVAATCRATATNGGPGVVEIASALRDANTTAVIDVPCIVHLVGSAPVSLARVTLTTRTLNLYDRGGVGAPSAISIADSRITATGPGSGLLLELDDAADRIAVAGTTLDAPAGVLVRAAGTRDGDNRGGTVQIARSTIRSTVAESAGVTVTAAETGGVVALTETGIATPGDVTVLADRCNATLRGKVLDCSVAALTRQLGG